MTAAPAGIGGRRRRAVRGRPQRFAVAGGRQHGGERPTRRVRGRPRPAKAPAGADESTCTPGSVAARRYRRGGGDHPSWPAVAGGLARPTRRLGRAALGRLLRGLAPGGVCRAAAVARGAGGLLPHRFTLTGRGRRSVLCGTVPRVAPGGSYPPPCSAESGLSSARFPGPRSPGRLVRAASLAPSPVFKQHRKTPSCLR